MRNDPIVEEVRKARDSYAARFDYNLDAIVLDLKRQERESGRKFITLPAKRLIVPTESVIDSVSVGEPGSRRH